MNPQYGQAKSPRRKPPKSKSEPMPLKWLLAIPVCIVLALWAGFSLTGAGRGGSEQARTIHAAAGQNARGERGSAQRAAAQADSSKAAGEEETSETKLIFIM